MDRQRKAEGRAAVRRGASILKITDAPKPHAPMLHRRPHAAHFRAHALANVDAKLRKSTYVIDPANVRATCGQQLQARVSSPESAVRFCCGCCVPGRAVVLLHRVRSNLLAPSPNHDLLSSS